MVEKTPKGEIGTLRIGLEITNKPDETVVRGDWLFAQRIQSPR